MKLGDSLPGVVRERGGEAPPQPPYAPPARRGPYTHTPQRPRFTNHPTDTPFCFSDVVETHRSFTCAVAGYARVSLPHGGRDTFTLSLPYRH